MEQQQSIPGQLCALGRGITRLFPLTLWHQGQRNKEQLMTVCLCCEEFIMWSKEIEAKPADERPKMIL